MKDIAERIEELEETKPGLFIAQDWKGKGTLFVDTRRDDAAVYCYHNGKSVNIPGSELPDSVTTFQAHVAAKGSAQLADFMNT